MHSLSVYQLSAQSYQSGASAYIYNSASQFGLSSIISV